MSEGHQTQFFKDLQDVIKCPLECNPTSPQEDIGAPDNLLEAI